MIEEENLIDDLEDIIPKEPYYNQKTEKDEKNQIDLLISIWKEWETQEKFFIFFGFNMYKLLKKGTLNLYCQGTIRNSL